jgi:hypothetical protein
VALELAYMRARTNGNHACGTSVIPFSIRNIDEMLADLGVPLSRRNRLAQWGRRVRPRDYRDVIGARFGTSAREGSTTAGVGCSFHPNGLKSPAWGRLRSC